MKHVTLPPIIYPTVIERVTHANVELPLSTEILIISFSLLGDKRDNVTCGHSAALLDYITTLPPALHQLSSASAAAKSPWLSCPLLSEGQTRLQAIFKYPFFNKYFIRRIKSIHGIYFKLQPIASLIIFRRENSLCFMVHSFRLNQAPRFF